MSFCDRIAPQMIAASYCMSVRLDPEFVCLGITYDPDTSLCHSCSTYKVSVRIARNPLKLETIPIHRLWYSGCPSG